MGRISDRHHCLDDGLAAVVNATTSPIGLPLGIRRFVEFNGGEEPISTLQRVVGELIERYSAMATSHPSISVELLCRILGVTLAGTPPNSPSRSGPSYTAGRPNLRASHTGVLRLEKSKAIVAIPDYVDRDTARLSVAHELGHFLIHWRGTHLDEATMRLPSTAAEEAMAEYAARLLLLPRERWLADSKVGNFAEYVVRQSGSAGVTIHSAAVRLGDPDLEDVQVSGAIIWRLPKPFVEGKPLYEQISPHWFKCPGAFVPIGKSRARPRSLVADLASCKHDMYESRVESVNIGSFTGTHQVDGYAWGSLERGTRTVLTVFRPQQSELAPPSVMPDRTCTTQGVLQFDFA